MVGVSPMIVGLEFVEGLGDGFGEGDGFGPGDGPGIAAKLYEVIV